MCLSDAASVDRSIVKMRLQNNSQMRCLDEMDHWKSIEHDGIDFQHRKLMLQTMKRQEPTSRVLFVGVTYC